MTASSLLVTSWYVQLFVVAVCSVVVIHYVIEWVCVRDRERHKQAERERLILLGKCPRNPYVCAGFSTVVPIRSPGSSRIVVTISKHDTQHFWTNKNVSKCLLALKINGCEMYTAQRYALSTKLRTSVFIARH